MTRAIIVHRDNQYVVVAEGGDLASALAAQTKIYSDAAEASTQEAAISAAMAESLVGPNYPSAVSGIAATVNGQSFAVDNGDGTVSIYRNSGGVAALQRKLATTTALAASGGSNFIGFSHANPYADGTVGAHLKRFVNVADAPFNAKGDGVADDTAAIQAAVDSMTSGGILHFSAGRFRLTDEIVIPPVGGLIFAGSGGTEFSFGSPVPGGTGTFIFQETDNKAIFKLGGGCSYIDFSDMTLSASNTPGANPIGVQRYGVSISATLPSVLWRITFNRVIFFNLARGVSCVDTAAGTHPVGQDLSVAPVTFNDCFWMYCSIGVFINTNNADLWKWNNCFMFIPSGGRGVVLKSFGMLIFDGVSAGGTAISNNRFISIEPGATGNVEKIHIRGGQTENLTHSLFIEPGAGYTTPFALHVQDSIFELGSDIYLGSKCHLVTDNNRFSGANIYIDHADVKLSTDTDQFDNSDYLFLNGSADTSFVNTTWGPSPSALYGKRRYERGTCANGSTANVANLTATTIITLPSEAGIYEVFAYIENGGPTYMTATRIACDGITLAKVGGDVDASGMAITLSSLNIQATQNSGAAQVVSWRWQRIA
ncbi:MAG: glycosyl hydrolase family 28-related protein [Shewanella sp.]